MATPYSLIIQNKMECRFYSLGLCNRGKKCDYIHADGIRQNEEESLENICKDKYKSQLLLKSQKETCGICNDIVWNKVNEKRRFGVLSGCNHLFCITCIKKWRSSLHLQNNRKCPVCRIHSDFVCASMYCVYTQEEKDTLINNYKRTMSQIPCKFYKKNPCECPYGKRCFYYHHSKREQKLALKRRKETLNKKEEKKEDKSIDSNLVPSKNKLMESEEEKEKRILEEEKKKKDLEEKKKEALKEKKKMKKKKRNRKKKISKKRSKVEKMILKKNIEEFKRNTKPVPVRHVFTQRYESELQEDTNHIDIGTAVDNAVRERAFSLVIDVSNNFYI